MISIGYYAAWADGELQPEELEFINSAKIDLDIELPDYTNKNNLPEWDTITSQISDNELASQAIELSSQIISAKGCVSQKEIEFMYKLCTDLKVNSDVIEDIVDCLKINTERMHKWNALIQLI